MKIKICGNTTPKDALEAHQAGADYLGLVFAESPRKVDFEQGKAIVKALPGFGGFVGVFCDPDEGEIDRMARALGIRIVQLHGHESPEFCNRLENKGYRIIKAVRVRDQNSFLGLNEYRVSHFLLDAFDPVRQGGTGKTFDWSLIGESRGLLGNFFLAGGLTPDNVAAAVALSRPYGVDTVSGVESSPGSKDPGLVRRFILSARKGDLPDDLS